MRNRLEIDARPSEREPGWIVSAWYGLEYRGSSLFIGYTREDAIKIAKERVRGEGGLGVYARA